MNERTNKQTNKQEKQSFLQECLVKASKTWTAIRAKCKETGPQTTQNDDYGSLAADSESVGPSLGIRR